MLTIHFQTGEWDAIYVWALKEGMGELEWTAVSPNFVKWKAALDEQVGGEDEESELLNCYNAALAHRKSEVGHYHLPSTE